MATVAILQPYVPRYRVPLFDGLRAALAEDGHVLRLVTGSKSGGQAGRGDEAPCQPGQVVVPSREVRIGPVGASWKRVAPQVRDAELVIAQLGAGILETHQVLTDRRLRVATWGHGFAATGYAGAADTALERRQLRRSCHFFAYTDRGAEAARRAGLTDDRITVLHNTIDTSELIAARAAVTPADVEQFRADLELGIGPVVAFIGGLDSSKRIDMLLETADRVAASFDGFRLIIAGDGPLRSVVQRAAQQPYIAYVGFADARSKARIAAVASVLVNPGRVGLIAVDSFALDVPIVTTDWFAHAPEFDYLRHGFNAVVTADNIGSYAAAVASLVLDTGRLDQLRSGCQESLGRFSLDTMIERFRTGIGTALAVPSTRSDTAR